MRFEVTAKILEKATNRARSLRPRVSQTGHGAYTVTCDKVHPHTVRFYELGNKIFAECDATLCPSRVPCYHIASAFPYYQIERLQPGDRVLVNEAYGQAWHSFIALDGKSVFTFEVPEGFSLVFVVGCEGAREMSARAA